jgi:KaiC/GvpD/RAD55 family RecA-like ATPase/tetratricopeptide (TPR) repeat protein
MHYLDSAFDGKGTTVFVSGEAGSGKTRLVHEFLETLKGKEVTVLSSWCLSDIAVPYFPFMEAFNTYFSAKKSEEKEHTSPQQPRNHPEQAEDEEAEIKAWLVGPKQAGKTERLQNLTPQAWKDLAVAAVTKAVLSISVKKVVILFIDDLQWADSASLSLLHYISRSISAARVLVLATYRSEELSPDAEGCPHPLLETLRLMSREDLFKEIKLPNLDHANIAALAEKMVGGSLHSELTGKLAEESGGNPLFVVESLRMLSEHGSLVQESGRWRLSIDEVGIPAKIRDIILRRVSMLKPNQRRILDLASVIGERFDAELLGVVLGQDSLEVLETLNAVGQSSSLVLYKGSYYEFDHAKSREAIYEEISPPLKKGYHERIAEKLEAKSKNSKLPVNDLAYHYAQAGNKEKAVEYALAAGEDALARFSNSEAIKHYGYVLATVSEASEYASERTAALEGLGDALNANGLFVEAMKTFEQLSSVAESNAMKLRALRKAFLCSYWRGDWAYSHELAAKAEEYAQFDRLEYSRLCLYRGFVAAREGKPKEAVEDEEGALRVFEEEVSLRDVAAALAEIIFIELWEVPIEARLAAALRSVALFKEIEDLRGEMFAYGRLGGVFERVGLFREALNSDEELLRIGERIGDYNNMALKLFSRGMRLEFMGDLRAAVASSLKAVECAEKTNAYFTQGLCYGNLIREYAMLGEIGHAEEFAKKIDKLFDEEVMRKSNKESFVHARINKAFLFSAKGQWKEANEIFEKFFEDLKKNKTLPIFSYRAGWMKDYAWALAKQGRIEESNVQLEEVQKIMRARESAGKLKLEHANVQASLMARREIGVGEELNIRLDLVNVAKNPALLVRVEGFIPPEFKASALPSYSRPQNGSLEMNERKIGPFQVETIKLSLNATKAGVFNLSPQVVYVDEMGETKTCKPTAITVTVRPTLHAKIGEETISVSILPDRVTTGFADLDTLLFGGIPENYAVVLASPQSNERELLIKHFLEAGAKAHSTTIYLTTEPGNAKALAKEFPSDFFLFVCNPRADAIIQSLPNIFKFKGVENLTEIDIALTKIFRVLDPSKPGSKRACIDIISDVLLQHHAVITRKWLSGILADLRLRGFTTLVAINPKMHPPEEFQAILGLFEGEINISEKETAKGIQQVLRIRKMYNQKFLENELALKRESLEQ